MFKVYVIVAGLAVVVPAERFPQLKGISAIVVDAKGKSDVVDDTIPKHSVTLSFRGGQRAVVLPVGTRIEIRKTCGAAPCRADLSEAAKFQPDLAKLSGKAIRESCVDPAMLAQCVDRQKRPLVHTWIGLEGAWTARAATTCSSELSRIEIDPVDWEYRKRKGTTKNLDPTPRPGNQVKLGNAYVFETDSTTEPPLNDVELLINGKPIRLSPAELNACASLSEGKTDHCAIVELTNHTHSPTSTSKADRHFALLYDLFDPNITERWVPYAKGDICRGMPIKGSLAADSQHALTPPGERCGGGGG